MLHVYHIVSTAYHLERKVAKFERSLDFLNAFIRTLILIIIVDKINSVLDLHGHPVSTVIN